MLSPETPPIQFETSLLLPNVLEALALENPSKPALVEHNKVVSWREMTGNVNRIANSLMRLGIRSGDRVAIMGRNSIEYSQLYCGIVTAGASAVPLSTMINGQTLRLMLEDSQARAIFITEEFIDLLVPFQHELDTIPGGTVSMGCRQPGWTQYEDWLNNSSERFPALDIDPDAEFNIIYSSGTTGVPKGIVHTHKIRYAMIRTLYEGGNMKVNLVATPLYSNTTIVCWLPTLYSGGTNVIMHRFNAEEALELIEKHKVTAAMFVPVQYDRMLRVENFDRHDLSSMKAKFCTSAPLRAHLKKDLLDRFPGSMHEFYGLTEGGPVATYNVADHPDRLDSVGQAAEGCILKVIGENDEELEPDQIGELVGRHGSMSKGYLNQQQATEDMFWYDRDGLLYYKSGDNGYIDKSGFVYLLDRKKDVIISGGLNIFATDLELALLDHPEVCEAAVVAAPDKVWGETPFAFVILEDSSQLTESELVEWVNQRLNKFQRISRIVFRSDLPKSPIGKILKRQLREEAGSAL